MTFFDELKRSASDVAEKAAKKTNELTNIAKLNMNMKSCESKLVSVYEEIGRMFYSAERNGEDYTSEIAANIMKADKLKADIAAIKAKLAKLKKVLVCEGCGNEISEDSAYCSYCGLKVVKPAEETDNEEVADDKEAVEDNSEKAEEPSEETSSEETDSE